MAPYITRVIIDTRWHVHYQPGLLSEADVAEEEEAAAAVCWDMEQRVR